MADTLQQNPSLGNDPADLHSMGGMLKFAFRKLMMDTDGWLPATVIAVDAARNYATVQPQILRVGTDGATISRPQYAAVPIFNMGAGNFVMSFPITPGDFGWIAASDRDISIFLQNMAQSAPNTDRLHSFEDGVYIPEKGRQWVLSDDDATNAVWQSLDGSIKISLGTSAITLTHPTMIILDTPLVEMKHDVKIDGDLTVVGTTHLEGDATGDGDITASGISLVHHVHSGVVAGPADTGPPV